MGESRSTEALDGAEAAGELCSARGRSRSFRVPALSRADSSGGSSVSSPSSSSSATAASSTNQQGALHTVARQPFREGPARRSSRSGLAATRSGGCSAPHSAAGPEGTDRASFRRIAAAGQARSPTAGSCALAVEILLGAGGGSNTGNAEAGGRRRSRLVARRSVARRRSGRAIMIGVALYQGYRGVSKKFLDDSKGRGEMG